MAEKLCSIISQINIGNKILKIFVENSSLESNRIIEVGSKLKLMPNF